jgi:hypothetical protein
MLSGTTPVHGNHSRKGRTSTRMPGSQLIIVPGRIFQEMNVMKKSSIMMLVASAILIAGILVAGCSQDSASVSGQPVEQTPTGSSGSISSSVTPGSAGSGDKPQFNQTAGSMGTPPDGMQMNGTRPSGTPPGGMQMNGTRPSGTPPSGSS